MSRRPSPARKTLNAANLAKLGRDRLAGLLIEAAAGDANLKRRLKLALAAAAGPGDLVLEIDKRLTTLATSRARVSWRKRPELLADLRMQLEAVAGDLAGADPALALPRLIAWFDLYPAPAGRVKDPKDELAALFFEAATRIADVAGRIDTAGTAPLLAEALSTRFSEWSGWLGRAAPSLPKALAERLVVHLTEGRPLATGRKALLVRKLADRAGRVDLWLETIPPEDRRRPDTAADLRLAARRGRQDVVKLEPSDAWDAAEIQLLEAEGQSRGATAARQALFDRTLNAEVLKDMLKRAADFEDVEILDRALERATQWPDANQGLAFLMAWPTLQEAASLDPRVDRRTSTIPSSGRPVVGVAFRTLSGCGPGSFAAFGDRAGPTRPRPLRRGPHPVGRSGGAGSSP